MSSATGDPRPYRHRALGDERRRRTDAFDATRADQRSLGRASDAVWEGRWLWLDRLRREFPGWLALFDPFAGVWVAVRGRGPYVVAATAYELRDRLRAAQWHRDRTVLPPPAPGRAPGSRSG